MLKIKEEKWKEFCTKAESLGFIKIARDVYGTPGNTNLVRISKSDICFISHTKEADNKILINEDYKFEKGFPKSVIKLIELGYVQFPELKMMQDTSASFEQTDIIRICDPIIESTEKICILKIGENNDETL